MLAHKGNIRAESILNRGCTFLLTLPPADPLPEASEQEPETTVQSELTKELPA
jgi:hypothetical protein